MRNSNKHKRLVAEFREEVDLDLDLESGKCRYGITKTQLLEIQDRFRIQKEEYERQNGVFLADERRKALYK